MSDGYGFGENVMTFTILIRYDVSFGNEIVFEVVFVPRNLRAKTNSVTRTGNGMWPSVAQIWPFYTENSV